MADDAANAVETARWVDARCDDFERALLDGETPIIEAFLGNAPEAARQVLLRELLGIEFEFRITRNEQPVAGEYQSRFPELPANEISEMLDEAQLHAEINRAARVRSTSPMPMTVLLPKSGAEEATASVDDVGHVVRYFGDYELLREIARGGMGVVFEARQCSLNRPVALKMILSGNLASAEDITRFRREAEAAAQLDHPGIVPIYEVGVDGDQHYFSMGYVSGPSLSKRLSDAPLDPVEAARLLREVALAVQFAHERGVVHRDLKPSNILLAPTTDDLTGAPSYVPRVTDFGLAKLSRSDHSLTETGQILGTPSYMPPEQAAGLVNDVGPASDIYSLGAVLYACLTGRPPFQSASVHDTVRQVLEREPASLRDLNAFIPADLETICHKCLEKSIPRRYATARDVADELQRFLEGRPINARPVSRIERVRRWSRRNPIVAGLLVAVVLLLVVGTATSSYFAWRESQRALAESNARGDEKLQRQEAERQTKIAKQLSINNLKLAEAETTARRKADASAEEARTQTKLAKHNLYAAHMQLIQAAWNANRVGEIDRLLSLYRMPAQPAEGHERRDDDLRGFEWNYWDSRIHSDLLTIKHGSWVHSVAFSPDGKFLAAGTLSTTPLKIFSMPSGQEVLSPAGHRGSLDSHPAFTGSWEFIRQHDLTTPITTVMSVAYRADGRQLASAGRDGTIRLWETETGREVLLLKGHSIGVEKCAINPDGTRLASIAFGSIVGDIREFKLWDLKTGNVVREMSGPDAIMMNIAFSPDGKRLLTAGTPSTNGTRIWDAETGELQLSLPGGVGLAAEFSPDGRKLVTVGNTCQIWDAIDGHALVSLKGHTEITTSVGFSRDGKRVVTGSEDQTVKVWNVETGAEIRTYRGHSERVNSVGFSPDGTRIASGSRDGTIKIWDATKSHEDRQLSVQFSSTKQFAFTSDGKHLVTAGPGRFIQRIDLENDRVVQTLNLIPADARSEQAGLIDCIALSSTNDLVAVGCSDKTIRVVELATGNQRHQFAATTDARTVAFHPSGNILLAGDRNTIRLWDIKQGEELPKLIGHKSTLSSLVFSPDGTWFASGSWDKTICTWDLTSGRLKATLKGHLQSVQSLAISPLGTLVASASNDRTAKIWNATTGDVIHTLSGHTDFVKSISFSPDGRRLITEGHDQTVRVWDVSTGMELLTWKETQGGIFNLTGTLLAVSEAVKYFRGNLRLIEVSPRDLADSPTLDVAPPVVALPNQILGARALQLEGDQLRERNSYPDAIRRYREVVELEPNNLAIVNRLAWIMSVSPLSPDDASETLGLARRASDAQPGNVNYRNTLGAALYRSGEYADALKNLEQVRQNASYNFQWHAHNLLLQSLCHLKLDARPLANERYAAALLIIQQTSAGTSRWHEVGLLQAEVESQLIPQKDLPK